MAVKRYIATKDNTITDAYKPDLRIRATGSNMGASDIVEVNSIYAQAASTSVEKTRFLMEFPTDNITTDRNNADIPASGSVSFYLRIFNAKHHQTLPRNFTLTVAPVSRSWEEGHGVDMESFADLTHDASGSSWVNAASGTAWTSQGGDFLTSSRYDVSFTDGTEDIEVDVSSLVEAWMAGTITNNGLGVFLTASQETGQGTSYYTKKFFARGSQYFFKRPIIEARWDSSRKDRRCNFYYSSSLADGDDNLNTVYLYNYVRGQLKDIPNLTNNRIYVSLYSGSTKPIEGPLSMSVGGGVATAGLPCTGGYAGTTGIYSASLCLTAGAPALTKLYDVWYSGTNIHHTGTIVPLSLTASSIDPNATYVSSIVNLRPVYYTSETARFRFYTRPKDWQPNIYTVASSTPEGECVEDAYYRIYRVRDDFQAIKYGTGSLNETRMSYDKDGNYFDLDIGLLEPGYSYGIEVLYYLNNKYAIQPDTFKFRVEEREK